MKHFVFAIACLAACVARGQPGEAMNTPAPAETATFAGGCFWCIEEIFRQQPGVARVQSTIADSMPTFSPASTSWAESFRGTLAAATSRVRPRNWAAPRSSRSLPGAEEGDFRGRQRGPQG